MGDVSLGGDRVGNGGRGVGKFEELQKKDLYIDLVKYL